MSVTDLVYNSKMNDPLHSNAGHPSTEPQEAFTPDSSESASYVAASQSTGGSNQTSQEGGYSLSDFVQGISHGLYYSRGHLWHSYVVIPVGIVILFTILYGLNKLLTSVIKITFPCSVLGMLINLVLLCVLNVLANLEGNNPWKVRVAQVATVSFNKYLTLIKPPMNFTLKWINVFFIPSFIILPLSDPITFIECLKIAGVFVIGFLLLLCVDVYMILSLQWVLKRFGLLKLDSDAHQVVESSSSSTSEEEYELDEFPRSTSVGVFTTMRDDITTIDIPRNEKITATREVRQPRGSNVSENPFEHDPPPQPQRVYLRGGEQSSIVSSSVLQPNPSLPTRAPPVLVSTVETPREIKTPLNLSPNAQRITIFLTKYIDWTLYCTLFVVSLPLYYVTSIHTFLPYHLGITILSYYLALLIPQKWPQLKKIAHPILISTAEILFVCFIGSLIYHNGKPKGFIDDLKFYKTGKNYLNLFNGKSMAESGKIIGKMTDDYTATSLWPGCGDVLSSLMDISIVSLSLPMFTHRRDFVRNFWVLMPPIIVSIALTFFCYPVFCYHIGIAPERSIGFIGRSVTLALGTPLITALNGSISLMAVCTILSGICGVLVGDPLFKLLRVKQNDYVTRGVSLGINCGAIATAHLLNVDPRAASMSSLSFSVFGTIMVVLASIVSVKDMIRSWVGL
ncbi:hypothetical protein CAAN3_04S05138 [[Candida] anglica]